MFRIEFLPGSVGDAILVSYGTTTTHHLLIDGGTSACAPPIARRVIELAEDVDLMVVTHIDTDHIGGALTLLRNHPEFTARVRGFWFNGFRHVEAASDLLGALDGEKFTDRLIELERPWNADWPWPEGPPQGFEAIGGPVAIAGDQLPVVTLPGGLRLTLLSPDAAKMSKLHPVWKPVIDAAGLTDDAVPAPPDEDGGGDMLGDRVPSLGELAARRPIQETKPANGSSIAFLAEYTEQPDGPVGAARTVRALFAADAHSDRLAQSLRTLGSPTEPVRLDVVKMSHHGSRANITTELVELISCPRWVISTSGGGTYHHPNAEALAKAIVSSRIRDPAAAVTLIANYRGPALEKFLADYPPAQHDYEVELPPAGSAGAVVTLL